MKIINFIIDLLFPKRCTFCNNVIGFEKKCRKCDVTNKILPIDFLTKELCDIKHLDGIVALFEYSGVVVDCIHRIKFYNDFQSAFSVADIMTKGFSASLFKEIDFILAVPEFKKDNNKIAFTAILADAISKKTGVQKIDVIKKIKQTQKQHMLNKKERRHNLHGAFCCDNTEIIKDKHLLIIDDVCTTGNTLNEVAGVAKAAGADRVYGFTFAS